MTTDGIEIDATSDLFAQIDNCVTDHDLMEAT